MKVREVFFRQLDPEMNWKHGYYADSGYTYGYYSETSPLRLAWAALIQGHALPTRNFRYLDAGCGQGLSLIMMAAAHPDSEFVGLDFLPEHIAHARDLAARCGLTNVTFIEGDFIALEEHPEPLGNFDYAICHGITTWIAPAVKRSLFSLFGKVLNPGGIFYNSYNTFPGWLPTVPFQHLVLLEQRSKTGALALKAARGHMEQLTENSTGMFGALPGLQARLKSMDTQDPAYLVQEYNNNFWQPVFVSQMMDDLAAVKMTYLGTATLVEAYDAVLAPKVRELLAAQAVPVIREQLRDYAINQSFRRDLYVKGQRRPWQNEQGELIHQFEVTRNPTISRPQDGQPFSIRSGTIELNGDNKFYASILDSLELSDGQLCVGQLIERVNSEMRLGVVSAVSMLLHGGWILPHQSYPEGAASKVNKAIGDAVCKGAPYLFISVPASGGAIPLGDAEWFVVRAAMSGVPDSEWLDILDSTMTRTRRAMSKDGKPVIDEKEKRALQMKVVDDVKTIKLPLLRRMGAL
jgi:SAM-dependent methyltransferase